MAPKAAGFVALFRVYFEGMGERAAAWIPIAAGLAAITIVGGNLMALPQQNTKRLLAYSGIAHIGYMLVGFAAASASGMAMVLFYLVAYVFGNMGAFLVVEAVARSERSEATVALRGLAQRSPLLALAMLLFLLSLGGIPFVAGFWAKLYVFWAAAKAGLYWLVLVGAVLTVVALFYYLVVAKRMYIEAPEAVRRAHSPFAHPRPGRRPLRARRGRARRLPQADRDGCPADRHAAVLSGPSRFWPFAASFGGRPSHPVRRGVIGSDGRGVDGDGGRRASGVSGIV